MRTKLYAGVAFAALIVPASAYAQSTGTVEFEETEIVVTGSRVNDGVGGVVVPDGSKTRGTLTQEFIARQTPGNTILDTLNQLPGVSFQNNDPYGGAGGTLTVRGFDASRISLTFDGIPLNDTGNYALYSNQQLDPELIEAVAVNYGSSDVDSPAAAASGSTINYRTIKPTDEFGVRLAGSVGDFDYMRVFGLVNTGVFTPWGTKAFLSASRQTNNWFVNDFGKVDKEQFNAKIYQPIGSNGDFISVAVNYNENRNNFGGSAPLRTDRTRSATDPTPRNPGTGSNDRFPVSMDEIPYHVARCTIPTGRPGVADAAGTCGTTFDERFNPSNTGNLRVSSRFTLADGLTLTVEPSFQYVKANGGGTVDAREGMFDINPGPGTALRTGYFGGKPYAGFDLNGDGDTLDTVNVLAPSQTQTRRYGVIAGLRYEFMDGQSVRVGYTFDRGRHRQTGEVGLLQIDGSPYNVFPAKNPVLAASGARLEKRDRLSYATLNQVFGQYRGDFGTVIFDVGLRASFFQRELDNRCFTSSASGFVECAGDAALNAQIAALHPYSVNAAGVPVANAWSPPQKRNYKYSRALPNVGVTWKPMDKVTAYVSYAKGIQPPGTDNLYNAFFFPRESDQANPTPETTDNFDGGIRYTSSKLQVQVGPWYTKFTNRLASAFDPETSTTVYRNLGRVDKYGVDVNIDYAPIPEVLIHAFGSVLKSEIKNDVQTAPGVFAATAGKRESGAPTYTFGGRVQGTLGPLQLGVQVKQTGGRYLNDQNLPVVLAGNYLVYPAKTPSYTLVDLDARIPLTWAGLNDRTYFQVNVQNLFNEFYVGGFSGGATSTTSIPFAQIGTPRTVLGTLNIAF